MKSSDSYVDASKELDFDDDYEHVGHGFKFKHLTRQCAPHGPHCEDSMLYCSNLEDVAEALKDAGYIKKAFKGNASG